MKRQTPFQLRLDEEEQKTEGSSKEEKNIWQEMNFYQILGVNKNATSEQVSERFSRHEDGAADHILQRYIKIHPELPAGTATTTSSKNKRGFAYFIQPQEKEKYNVVLREKTTDIR